MKLLSTKIRGIPLHYLLESRLMPAVNHFYQTLNETSYIEPGLTFILAFVCCLASIAGFIFLILNETAINEVSLGFMSLSGLILLMLTVLQYIRANFASKINIAVRLVDQFHTIGQSHDAVCAAIKEALIGYAEEQLFHDECRGRMTDAQSKSDSFRKKRETLHKTVEALGMELGPYNDYYAEAQ